MAGLRRPARPRLRSAALSAVALLAFAGGVQAAASRHTSPSASEVATTGGLLRGGVQADGSVLFRAVPYAAPPLGALRWRPPQPPAAWSGVRDVQSPAAPCAQPALGWNDAMAGRSAEDCLYLEVQTPALRPPAPAPVMVWIHGGANVAGGADGYLPSALVGEGVVLVTVQYRLGVFGFLSLPELRAGLPRQAAGNFALLDQIAALRWVRDNIAGFGGDPRRVTIFGQSAGAQDVGLLQLSPLARGLFSGAIEQSGTAGFGLPARPLAEHRALGDSIAARAGVVAGKDRLARLRALPAAQLIAAAQGLDVPALDDDGYLWLQAVVDGEVLPEAPEALLAQGRQTPVPLLIGSNAQELELGDGEAGALARLRRDYAGQAAQVTQWLAGAPPAPRAGSASMRLATDLTFRCPSRRVAQAQAARGLPVWLYEFDRAVAGGQVGHSAELAFVFKALPLDAAATSLARYWAAFARDGDPNGAGLPAWPGFAPDARSLSIGPSGVAAVAAPEAEVCALLTRP
jgi:para-nitrobenzyl esterase